MLQLKSYPKLMLQNDFQDRMNEDETVACSLDESFLSLDLQSFRSLLELIFVWLIFAPIKVLSEINVTK